MAKMSQADFFFGGALSVLFNNDMTPALVENGNERRIYDVYTDTGDYRIYMKYRSKPTTDKDDYTSWQFNFNQQEIGEFKEKINENIKLILICGKENLKDSEIALLDSDEINKAICSNNRFNITISRKKHSPYFRISMGGGHANDLPIKANRIVKGGLV